MTSIGSRFRSHVHAACCRYAGYTVTTHTSPEPASAAASQVQHIMFPGSSARPDTTGASGEAENAGSLFVDNGLLRVELSNVTGQVVGLLNQQAQVCQLLCHRDEALP